MVAKFASGLTHPRWLYTLRNSDVLVAESDSPDEQDQGGGLFGWIRRHFIKRASGACQVPIASCSYGCQRKWRGIDAECVFAGSAFAVWHGPHQKAERLLW